jgi:DUF1680 family protein
MKASIVTEPTAASGSITSTGGPVVPTRSVLRPLGPDEVTITGGLWADYQALNATAIIDHCFTWMERTGWIGNFDAIAAGGSDHSGIEFTDSEIYKLLEGMAWELARQPDAALASRFEALVARVAAAQDADGYLNTAFGHPGQRERFSDLEWGHELYCAGRLLQAAVARLRTGHDDLLVTVARGVADHLYGEFGPSGRAAICGHPEVEVALAEFSRATGERRYLELARLFVERRGHGLLKPISLGQDYFQDDVPVRDADVLRGHAVRALYLAAGAFDVAVDSGNVELADAIARQWDATLARRTYITGGLGSRHTGEAIGADWELPPDRAYSETCAGIASVMLNWRLLLQSGEARYGDVIERTLLNNILASPRADGHAFFYANPLQQRVANGEAPHDEVSLRADSTLRAPWFEVSCCPPNVARTLASVAMYFATADDEGIQLHQYATYRVSTDVGGRSVTLSVDSGYPFDGSVRVTVETGGVLVMRLRVPSWADGANWQVPDGVAASPSDGWLEVRGEFAAGDVVTLSLPMDPRIARPDPRIDAVRGQIAVERGPLVLALESADVPGELDAAEVAIDADAGLEPTAHGAKVTLVAVGDWAVGWPYGATHDAEPTSLGEAELIPYYQWANRGPSTMRVFIPLA